MWLLAELDDYSGYRAAVKTYYLINYVNKCNGLAKDVC